MVGASANKGEFMTKEKLMKESKEQIIIYLLNSEKTRIQLHRRLEKLTGCSEFGLCDGTVGFCVECSYEQPELFDKCWNFKFDK